jgi:KipI family sensor histidine kinase inhibitor
VTVSVSWFGDRAVMIAVQDADARDAVMSAVVDALPGMGVRAGMRSVLVEVAQPDPRLLGAVEAAVATAGTVRAARTKDPRAVVIPVAYAGSDLADVASALAISAEALVAAHRAQPWSVAMMGFAPGFAYLVPDGEPVLPWHSVPRRARPRERVPAGSVAVAAGMSGVYPVEMPGGWHLIGETDVTLFDPRDDAAPSLLRHGDRVRFVDRTS